MSVLIRGMEMPKCDIDCPVFTEEICPIESVLALSEVKEERHPDCPLVPVPPHGRLIDADELFKEIGMDGRFGILEAMCIQSIIHDAPTIIPAEEGER